MISQVSEKKKPYFASKKNFLGENLPITKFENFLMSMFDPKIEVDLVMDKKGTRLYQILRLLKTFPIS